MKIFLEISIQYLAIREWEVRIEGPGLGNRIHATLLGRMENWPRKVDPVSLFMLWRWGAWLAEGKTATEGLLGWVLSALNNLHFSALEESREEFLSPLFY